MARTLVIENDPDHDIGRLGGWLASAGLSLEINRPHVGEQLPESLDGYAALVVLGGERDADHIPGRDPALGPLLRAAVRGQVPTLAIGRGAHLLATAHGGEVAPAAEPEIGPHLVAKRDVAEKDPLWAPVPMAPDVMQWHRDEITELPLGATLLAASPRGPHQAFRIGASAWGLQFHIECDTAMIARWSDDPWLAELGLEPAEVIEVCDAIMPDLAEAWQPFAARFAAVARRESPGVRSLPLLDH